MDSIQWNKINCHFSQRLGTSTKVIFISRCGSTLECCVFFCCCCCAFCTRVFNFIFSTLYTFSCVYVCYEERVHGAVDLWVWMVCGILFVFVFFCLFFIIKQIPNNDERIKLWQWIEWKKNSQTLQRFEITEEKKLKIPEALNMRFPLITRHTKPKLEHWHNNIHLNFVFFSVHSLFIISLLCIITKPWPLCKQYMKLCINTAHRN